jgi:hypothetical protein
MKEETKRGKKGGGGGCRKGRRGEGENGRYNAGGGDALPPPFFLDLRAYRSL